MFHLDFLYDYWSWDYPLLQSLSCVLCQEICRQNFPDVRDWSKMPEAPGTAGADQSQLPMMPITAPDDVAKVVITRGSLHTAAQRCGDLAMCPYRSKLTNKQSNFIEM